MNTRQQQIEAFGRLLDIMDDLREKCPWDQKQTLQTLRHLTLEEVYELSAAPKVKASTSSAKGAPKSTHRKMG